MHLIRWCYTIAACMFKFTGWDGGGGRPGISVNLSRDLPSLGWQVCLLESVLGLVLWYREVSLQLSTRGCKFLAWVYIATTVCICTAVLVQSLVDFIYTKRIKAWNFAQMFVSKAVARGGSPGSEEPPQTKKSPLKGPLECTKRSTRMYEKVH